MPRNSSGTYTLPAGNPVVSGTLIEASWANNTLSDLASAMTNSLSRGGEGGMTAALRLYDGTVSLPGLAFTNETSTGLYRAGSGDMRLAVTGSQVMQFLSTGVAVTGTLSASGNATLSGTLAVTGASTFSGQTNTFENSTAYYPQLINRNKTADANGSYISLQKIRGSSVVQNGDVLGNVIFAGYDGASYLQGAFINAVISATPGTNDMPTDLVFGTTADGGAGPTQRARIKSDGSFVWTPDGSTQAMTLDASSNLLVGVASTYALPGSQSASVFTTTGYAVGNGTTSVLIQNNKLAFNASNFYVINGNTGTGVGVYIANGNTSWSAFSDERIKDIIEPISDAANKVLTLRAVIGKYKKDKEGTRRSFLIAQDVQAVLPEAVNTQDDEIGTLGVQYTDTIPLLVAAIQEQQAIIEGLTARVAALETTP